ncbi:MAG: 50S ribosomal protein L5 [archaeon GB-1867-035]|nr:50S ribosomal protein L5 [Candidatus Culexmicrobium profundum]
MEEELVMTEEKINPMQRVKIGKVVVNIAVGESGEKLEKAVKVLESLTGQKPLRRKAKRTIREFGIRKGENIACVVTLRGNKAKEFLRRALVAVGNRIKARSFDPYGNISFGIREHIDIPGTKYDPNIGIFGMDVCISLERPGYRVMRRRIKKSRIDKKHRVTAIEAMEYMKREFGVEIVEE